MTHRCPIENCPNPVAGPLRLCRFCFAAVPAPIQSALNSYARSHKGGPAHRASFDRAVESVTKLIEARRPVVAPEMPARAPWWAD